MVRSVRRTSRIEVIEIPLGTAFKNSYQLPQNLKYLEDAIVERIEAYPATVIPTTPSGATTVNNTVFSNTFLKLRVDGEDKINFQPLYSLNPANMNGNREEYNDIKIDFSKSYIQLGSNAGFNVAGESVLLVVTFRNKGDKE